MKYTKKITSAYGDKVKEDLKKALSIIDMLPNGVAAWKAAHGENSALADQNADKCNKAAKFLSEILASLPAAMTYVVVGLDNTNVKTGDFASKFDSVDKLIKVLAKKGIKKTGDKAGKHLRPELQNQPTFDKLIGPMFGGAGIVRYETQEVNNRLSH
jgi:hypothetical protein